MRRIGATVIAAVLLSGAGAGIASAVPPDGMPDEAWYGICTAYFASQNGRDNSGQNPPPFQALEDEADDAGQSVEDFCAQQTPGRSGNDNAPTPNEHPGNRGGGNGNG